MWCSATINFKDHAEALEWILKEHGYRHVIHYLDDFHSFVLCIRLECQTGLNTMLSTCNSFSVPLAEEKIEGLSAHLSFSRTN